MRTLPLATALLAALTLAACGADEGDGCNGPICKDDRTAFSCDNGKYRRIPCPGSYGCQTSPEGDILWIICDFDGAGAGDPCPLDTAGGGICIGTDAVLHCNGETFSRRECTKCQQVRGQQHLTYTCG